MKKAMKRPVKRALFPSAFIVLIALSACGTLRPVGTPEPAGGGSSLRRVFTAVFTRAALADLQFVGVAGPSPSRDLAAELLGAQSPEIAAALQLVTSLRLVESVGPRLLPMTVEGETGERVLVCRSKMAPDCAALLVNTPIRVYVQPVGVGGYSVFVVHRLVRL